MGHYIVNFFKDLIKFSAKAFFVFLLVLLTVYLGLNTYFSQQQRLNEPRLFRVEGTAKRNVKHDIVYLTVGTTLEGKNVVEIQNNANKNINDAINAVMALGIPEEKIQTANYDLRQEYDKDGKLIESYSLYIALRVTIEDADAKSELPGDVIEAASVTGLNQVSSLSYDVKDRDLILEELKLEAVANAKTKKDTLAKASELRLGELKNVDFGGNYYYSGYDKDLTATESAPAAADIVNVNIESGETELSVTVNLYYEIL